MLAILQNENYEKQVHDETGSPLHQSCLMYYIY